jgi:Tfp pilus assembly protein PilN
MKAKLRPIAVEFQPLSFIRAFPFIPEHTILVPLTGKNHTVAFIARNNVILFQRIIPRNVVPERNIDTEIKEIADYHAAEFGAINEIIDPSLLVMSPTLLELDKRVKGNDMKWATVLGAALRGAMPRGKDTLISLMPIGTEEAYRYQKAATFTEFLSSTTVGLSIFFTVMMAGAWMFAVLLEGQSLNRIDTQAPVVQTEVAEMEARAQQLSGLLATDAGIIHTLPRWSLVLEKFEPLVGQDILINALSVDTPQTPITLSGIAKTRSELNAFKRRLEESGIASNIILPIGNLELKQNIPFMLSFIFARPEELYIY